MEELRDLGSVWWLGGDVTIMEGPHTATQDRPGGVSRLGRVKAVVSDVLRSGAQIMVESRQGQENDEATPIIIGGEQASAWLMQSADYVERLDVDQLTSKIQRVIRAHPGVSLLTVGAVGFLIGSLIRRR
jgi:hypothetical protein